MSEEVTALIRHAHGYAWRRRMNRELGVVLGDERDSLRARPGLCDQLASLAGRIQHDYAPTETLVKTLCSAAEQTGAVPAERIAGRLALHVADPAVAGAMRLRRGIQVTGVYCCVAEHRDLLDCPCLRQLLAEREPAAAARVLERALDDYVAPVGGIWPALTN